jgi:PAP2 superfamily
LSDLFWETTTRFGEAQILIPVMLAVVAWLVARSHAPRAALVWLLCTGVAASITTGTKIAFMGWGIGYAPLNFAGISGHAMFGSAILPVLARVLVADAEPRRQRGAVAAGLALALLIAISRVMVGAHSVSEIAAGFTLGTMASAVALVGMHVPPNHASKVLVGGLVVWLAVTVVSAPPPRTHDWVAGLAVALSGRDEPYQRWMMLRDYRQEMRRRGEPLPERWRPRPAARQR